MKIRISGQFVRLTILALGAAFCCPSAYAAEPAREFLEALRAKGYHDVALEYLDKMATSPLAPVEFREIILFEKGATLIDAARRQRDLAIREQQLNEAYAVLQQFVRQRAGNPMIDAAKNQLGNVTVERARMKVESAERKGGDEALTQEARELFTQAYKVFATRQNELRDRLSKMKKVYDPKTEKREIEKRAVARHDYLQAMLLSAAILEESADAYPEGSKENRDFLERAAREYEVIYEKHRRLVAGLYARMYQGRCDQKLGKYVDALSYYGELLENDDEDDAFRVLKTRVLNLALDCWLHESQKKYLEAVTRGSEWVAKSKAIDARDPEWLSIRLKTARAHKLYSEHLQTEDPKDPEINKLRVEARKLATFVSRVPSDYQREARQFLVDLRGGDIAKEDRPKPRNFLEAKTRGKEAIDELQTAGLVVQTVPDRLQNEKDEETRKELQKQLDDARRSLTTARVEAVDMFRLAMTLSDEETPRDELNVVRYFLCYLYYLQGDFYDSALMGEFVAHRFPDSSGARQSAKIALASYVKLYAENIKGDTTFETSRIVDIAEYIADKWPDQVEAEEALNTLIPFMINDGKLDKAKEYLNKIPVDSPKRGEAELKTGKAMWTSYILGMQEVRKWETDGAPEGVNIETRKKELEATMLQAQKVLEDGVNRMRQGAVNETLVTAVLSLAQIYLDTEQAAKSVALLEDPKVGALTLVKSGHPATKGPDFAEETYKTTLRAYIAALPGSSDADALIAKAKQTMGVLKSTVARDAAGQRKLVSIYVGLARDLERQMALASPKAKQSLSKGFETFLKQVGAESAEFNVLNWVGETFYSLGKGFDDGKRPSKTALRYYQEAITTYEKILSSNLAQGQLKTQVQMRLAVTKRQMKKFTDAQKLFKEILQENNVMLNVQVEAARTYQEWGDLVQKPGDKVKLYGYAMKGAYTDRTKKRPTNIIWGWGKLARLTSGKKDFRDTFHESRVNLAQCRLKSAMATAAKDQKEKLLKSAQRDIELTWRLYPKMGGQKWRIRYDALLKQVQRELGQTPRGLAALQQKTAAK